ncbi:MAG: DUF1573 domain-containing protein [Bacteroidota bacterium]|jgi:hypothetical protein
MRSLLIIIGLTAGMNAFAQEQIPQKETKNKKETVDQKNKGLTFNMLVIERNDIPFGADELFVFEFKNNSKTPAIIQGVQTSCGCTTANKPEAPVQPGKKSQISVKYDTKRVGPFTKTITVTSNVGEAITLTIKGSVLPETKQQ